MRLQNNKNLDQTKKISFFFDGKKYYGYEGDTLASALLSNGVHLIGRSFKYHRPRGIISAGCEEPNGIVQLELNEFTEPNRRATEVILYDGSYHEVDSSEMAFKIAGSIAVKSGIVNAGPIILEPIMLRNL